MNKQQQKKVTKWYHCAAEGCTSDDRKRAKYPYMQNVRFHSFPTEKKNSKLREKWLKLLRRDDAYFVPTFKQRVCSLHFVDGEPTSEHPYPELFSYNNFKNMTTPYDTTIPASDTVKKLSSARSRISATSMPTEDDCVHVTDENILHVFRGIHHLQLKKLQFRQLTKRPGSAYYLKYKDQACQTILTGGDIDRLISLEKNRDVLLREAVVDIVTKNDESVKKYTGVPCKSQLIGIFGAFSFISDLWGGNTSDKYSTEHSSFLYLIKTGDEIMADRGFTIRDLLTDRSATLVIPPFTTKCKW
ncbi:Hypothetical predicted protein [Mytilus galloprovincialis]|uniref:THAP-type domain-containing protein n=1 Tax=Mytilus galloprovincialis TaxID=29158 RepID=A0A8B6FK55_MYTGA|nr:Hypothetical predicted protein [Mytilus galloprovincialis]